MAKKRRVPAYVHHKPTGQARVRIKGKDHYLGKYGTPESHDLYDELVAEYIAADPTTATTLSAVLSAWWAECKKRYSKGKGKLGGAQNWRSLIRLLRTHHGEERAEELGPVKLRKLLQGEAERKGWSLRYTRMQLQRVRQIFKWAPGEELIGATAFSKITIFGKTHLNHLQCEFTEYYNTVRSHMGRDHLPPRPEEPDEIETLPLNEVEVKSYVGELVQSFERKVA